MNYISSAGMRVFLMALKHLKNNDGQLRLSGLTEDTKQIFDIAGFASFFDIYNTAEEAIRFF
jgi:anti-anti-sigma factor